MYQQHLEELLEELKTKLSDLPEEIQAAYRDTPRHLFADIFLDWKKEEDTYTYKEVKTTPENLEKYLPRIYSNTTICLALDDDKKWISSISQPSLVLMMLQKLQIEKGQKVLEIGTASGWNAAMMAKLVGEEGHVYSIDILSDLIVRAKARVKAQNITNLSLFDGDGATEMYGESFDRIMFTVGSYDIPESIHKQLKEGGLLLAVVKNKCFWDCLVLLKKVGNCLESIENGPCGFVPLKGAYEMTELNPINLEDLPLWNELKNQIVCEQDFWWGSNSLFLMKHRKKTGGITSFLSIVEPQFEIFNDEDAVAFGLVDEQQSSIVVWKDDKLIGYGNPTAFERIKAHFELYVKLGMPSSTCFKLKVYPKEETVALGENEWLIRRKDSQFVWGI